MITKKTKPFKKPCSRCGTTFQPSGKAAKLCDDCYKKARFGIMKKREKQI